MTADRTFRILLSYHYFRKTDLDRMMVELFGEDADVEVFADSGAFSAMTQGAPIDLDDYAEWVKRWRHLFVVYSNLDVIGDGETAAAATWDNQQRMEQDHGLAPLPVFHAGEPWSWLDRYLEAGYGYIALGGLVGRRVKAIMPWAVQAFRAARETGTVFHGFGLTSWEPLRDLPWYSVDSTRWTVGYRFGGMVLFDKRDRRLRMVSTNHAGVYDDNGRRIIRSYGFDPATFSVNRAPEMRPLMCQLSAVSWKTVESWLRERHGTVELPASRRLPEGGRPPGPKLHLATGDTYQFQQGHVGLKLYLAEAAPGPFANAYAGLRPKEQATP